MTDAKSTRVFLMTLLTMLGMCGIVVLCSLSPLSTLGEHANQFGDSGMFSALLGVAAPYLVPGILLASGFWAAKIILAVVHGVFFLGSAAVGITAFILWQTLFSAQPDAAMIGLLLCCAATAVLHIVWFPMAFLKEKR